jgi:hypothetical protein
MEDPPDLVEVVQLLHGFLQVYLWVKHQDLSNILVVAVVVLDCAQ